MNTELFIRLRDVSCGLFLMFQILGTLALYIKGRHHHLQRTAFYFMLYLLLLSLFEFYVFFIHNFLGDDVVFITDMLQMTVVPLALMLLYRLTHMQSMRVLYAVINIFPYVGAILVYIICPSEAIYNMILLVAFIHSFMIIGFGYVAVRQFNKRLVANFSSDENLSLRWMRLLLLLYVSLAIVWFLATRFATPFAATIYNVACPVIFGLLCYFVYRQEDMLEILHMSNIEDNDSIESQTSLPVNIVDSQMRYHFDEVFKKLFTEKHIYLNPLLNINDLAHELGTNRTYVSNYINQQLNTTFYDYVNNWRMKQALYLLNTTELSLQEIASQAGFNSISSFRRYFVSTMGQTPSVYKKMLKSQQ